MGCGGPGGVYVTVTIIIRPTGAKRNERGLIGLDGVEEKRVDVRS